MAQAGFPSFFGVDASEHFFQGQVFSFRINGNIFQRNDFSVGIGREAFPVNKRFYNDGIGGITDQFLQAGFS